MRYFALIDILGFGTYVTSHSLNEIENMYARMLTGIQLSKTLSERDGIALDYQIHSDTICIIAPDDSIRSLHKLIKVCHIQLCQYFYLLGLSGPEQLPLRGAIAKSDLVFGDRQFTTQAPGRDPITTKPIPTLLGKAVVQADRWEKCQEWSGISLCPDLYEEMKANPALLPLLRSHLLVEYDVPTKDGKSFKTLAINPIETIQVDRLMPLLDEQNNGLKLHPKVKATVAFIDYIVTHKLCYP